ncbi:MAG: hypothetical protein KJ571_00965 [Bacteroidetes bacterium]|nr:hypothetical protein [Bacteroidota bacterium]
MNLPFKILLLISLVIILISCGRDTVLEPIVDDTPPGIPGGFQVFGARDGEIGIEWKKNPDPNDKYLIYRSVNNQDNYKLIDSTFDEFYIDFPLSYDSTYYYKISAKDNFNRESGKTAAVFAQPINLRSPLVPRSLDISARNWSGSIYIYLNWYSSESSDVLGYEVYRDTLENFTPDSSNIIGFTNNLFFVDTRNLIMLEEYYYKLKAVDKGGLKSVESAEVSDYVLNNPELIFPSNNINTNNFNFVEIKTVSKPADYKIVFQTNEFFGTIYEINVYSDEIDKVISVPLQSVSVFSPYKKYYWRVFTYSVNSSDPNSFSDLHSFTITAQ